MIRSIASSVFALPVRRLAWHELKIRQHKIYPVRSHQRNDKSGSDRNIRDGGWSQPGYNRAFEAFELSKVYKYRAADASRYSANWNID